jgi:hypothetical protein
MPQGKNLVPLLALLVLSIAALLVIAYVSFQWWDAYHFYGITSADVKDKLDSYKVQVDDLQRMVSLLVTFSSLYALVLGVTSYLSAQSLLEQSKENAKRIEALRTDIEKSYPFFKNMGDRMKSVNEHLEALMPDSDERGDYFERLSPADKQNLEVVEQSAVSWLYFLDFSGEREMASNIHRNLGKYYSARYQHQRDALEQEIKDASQLPATNPARNVDVVERRRAIDLLAQRARFFLSSAMEKNPDNFLAYNDLAYLFQDMESTVSSAAESLYLSSVRLDSKQQRAYYNLALIEHGRKEYKKAEELSTRALLNSKWQTRQNAEREDDIHYNRACYRSRLQNADGTEEDLRGSCKAKDQKRLDLLIGDCGTDGDLEWFASQRPTVIDALKRILAG